MAQVTFNADMRIRVVFPTVTKSLRIDDRKTLTASGTFAYTPKPQVDSAQSSLSEKDVTGTTSTTDRTANLIGDLDDLLKEIAKIKKAMRKKAKRVVFEYDPLVTANEAYADAEETLFGAASGTITYDMFESILDFEAKVDAWISHQSIANGGNLSGA
jgi:hypothetical protein